jgi:hypothetical protein
MPWQTLQRCMAVHERLFQKMSSICYSLKFFEEIAVKAGKPRKVRWPFFLFSLFEKSSLHVISH